MGLATSKDASGRVVIPGVSPDILDYKGRDLRDELDACLNQNMWYCTALGMVLCVPVSFKYRTERPLFAAAILSPLADMWYGEWLPQPTLCCCGFAPLTAPPADDRISTPPAGAPLPWQPRYATLYLTCNPRNSMGNWMPVRRAVLTHNAHALLVNCSQLMHGMPDAPQASTGASRRSRRT